MGSMYQLPQEDTITFEFQALRDSKKYTVTLPWVVSRDNLCYQISRQLIKKLNGATLPAEAKMIPIPSLGREKPPKQLTIKDNLIRASHPILNQVNQYKPKAAVAGMEVEPTTDPAVSWSIYKPESHNMGVIYLSSFEPRDNDVDAVVLLIRNLMVNELKDTKSLLFDIRSNGGGIINMAQNIIQLFHMHTEIAPARALVSPINSNIFSQFSPNDP
jgi:Peptidase family S41